MDVSRSKISESEKGYLKELSYKYKELCDRKVNKTKREKWYKINDLDRNAIPAFINHYWPLALKQIFTPDTYFCKNDRAKEFELYFKNKIFYAEDLGDDNVLEPVVPFKIIYDYFAFGENFSRKIKRHVIDDYGMEREVIYSLPTGECKEAEEGGTYEIVPVLNNESDLLNIPMPKLVYHKSESFENYREACEIFEPILKVIKSPVINGCRVVDEYSWLRGMEQSYMDLYDRPEKLKDSLKLIAENIKNRFRLFESAGIWGTLDLSVPLNSAGLRYIKGMKDYSSVIDPFNYGVKLEDSWGNTVNELFTCVSDEMYKEFSILMDKQIMSMFKHINVGCCEVMDRKVKLVNNYFNARKVSVSEWCNHKLAAQNITDKYVFSYRAAGVHFVMSDFDKVSAQKEIQSVLENTKEYGCKTEIILNIGGTLGVNPREKVIAWSHLVKELINKYY